MAANYYRKHQRCTLLYPRLLLSCNAEAQEHTSGFSTVGDARISAYALICLLITDKLSNNVVWQLRNLC